MIERACDTLNGAGYANLATTVVCRYLCMIGVLPKISHLNHRRWEQYLSGSRPLPDLEFNDE